MPNLVALENDMVVYQFIGDQSYDTIMDLAPKVHALCHELQRQGKAVLMLVDLTKIGAQDAGTRRAVAEELKILPVKKVAVFGSNLFIKYVADFIIRASHKTETVKYFDTRDQAITWLKS